MTDFDAKSSAFRAPLHFAIALALLALPAIVMQLPDAPTSDPAPLKGVQRGGIVAPSRHVRDDSSELKELYSHCPMAAVVDLQTVADSPQKASAILPPYRQTVDRVPNAPPVDVPTIRYPVPLRIASLPKDATGASAPTTSKDDWLIDPEDWFAPDKRDTDKPQQRTDSTNDKPTVINPHAADTAPSTLVSPQATNEKPAPTPSSASPTPPVEPPVPTIQFAPPPLPAHEPTPPASTPVPATSAPPQTPAQPQPQEEQLPSVTQPTDLFAPPSSPAPATAPLPPSPHGPSTAPRTAPGVDPHLELYAENAYPSARECATCHEDIYHEWSMSAHAYATVSPMFHKFEQRLNDLSQGTVGYFCVRCHSPVATSLCESRAEPIWNMPEVAREGITCVACHRVQYIYGKSNGERRIETGNIFAPVLGGIGGEGIAEVIQRKDEFKVKTSPDEQGPGQDMHVTGIYFEPLTKSEFCTPCHQVAVYPGIKLEVVWEQYRASPACKKGIQCQDCHMGRVPGLPLGYNCGPVAKVAGKTVNDNRKRSNHVFYGPNYSIAHPGIFPFHLKANRWTMQDWLAFDWRAGWGTDAFEKQVKAGQLKPCFPPVWAEADDRYDAREIIEENIKKLNLKRDLRVQVMENGSHVEGPFFDSNRCRGEDLDFHYLVTNTNEGHNLLTASLGAQPQLWANIVLIGPDGRRLWETGYTDSFGDVANIHSYDVRHKKTPFDWQLFNLQTMFLITGAKGTDREFYVPVNLDIDQLPFIRPGTQPITVLNHPPFIRMESQSLAPLGSRRVPYRIPGELLQQPGTYRLSFRMRSRAEPIYFMQFCGATEDMQRSMIEWMIDVHPKTIEFTIP